MLWSLSTRPSLPGRHDVAKRLPQNRRHQNRSRSGITDDRPCCADLIIVPIYRERKAQSPRQARSFASACFGAQTECHRASDRPRTRQQMPSPMHHRAVGDSGWFPTVACPKGLDHFRPFYGPYGYPLVAGIKAEFAFAQMNVPLFNVTRRADFLFRPM